MGFVGTLLDRWRANDLGSFDKAILGVERSLAAVGMGNVVTIGRHDFYELARAPILLEGLPGLEIRTAGEADLDGLCSVAETPPALVLDRLRRGDVVYAGFSAGRLVCHIWFHRGTRPFVEDEATLARWALAPTAFWSYGGAARDQGSGAFVVTLQTALCDLFALHGAERVQCRIRRANRIASLLHRRIGFERIGTVTGVGTPWLRTLVWTDAESHRARSFLIGPNSAVAVPIPPANT